MSSSEGGDVRVFLTVGYFLVLDILRRRHRVRPTVTFSPYLSLPDLLDLLCLGARKQQDAFMDSVSAHVVVCVSLFIRYDY